MPNHYDEIRLWFLDVTVFGGGGGILRACMWGGVHATLVGT